MTKEEIEFKKYYLKEFIFFDGECDITFNIVGINFDKRVIEVAVSNRGKISVIEYDLCQDKNGNFYFIYGIDRNEIAIDDFEKIED